MSGLLRRKVPAFRDDYGVVLTNLHEKSEDCVANGCVIHAPSKHRMLKWKLLWRSDRRMFERTCPCGVGHPDPDWLAWRLRTDGEEARYEGVHGCCGCCRVEVSK